MVVLVSLLVHWLTAAACAYHAYRWLRGERAFDDVALTGGFLTLGATHLCLSGLLFFFPYAATLNFGELVHREAPFFLGSWLAGSGKVFQPLSFHFEGVGLGMVHAIAALTFFFLAFFKQTGTGRKPEEESGMFAAVLGTLGFWVIHSFPSAEGVWVGLAFAVALPSALFVRRHPVEAAFSLAGLFLLAANPAELLARMQGESATTYGGWFGVLGWLIMFRCGPFFNPAKREMPATAGQFLGLRALSGLVCFEAFLFWRRQHDTAPYDAFMLWAFGLAALISFLKVWALRDRQAALSAFTTLLRQFSVWITVWVGFGATDPAVRLQAELIGWSLMVSTFLWSVWVSLGWARLGKPTGVFWAGAGVATAALAGLPPFGAAEAWFKVLETASQNPFVLSACAMVCWALGSTAADVAFRPDREARPESAKATATQSVLYVMILLLGLAVGGLLPSVRSGNLLGSWGASMRVNGLQVLGNAVDGKATSVFATPALVQLYAPVVADSENALALFSALMVFVLVAVGVGIFLAGHPWTQQFRQRIQRYAETHARLEMLFFFTPGRKLPEGPSALLQRVLAGPARLPARWSEAMGRWTAGAFRFAGRAHSWESALSGRGQLVLGLVAIFLSVLVALLLSGKAFG